MSNATERPVVVSAQRMTEFVQELEKGQLTIPQTVRLLRKTTNLTIPEYAKYVGISSRYLGDIERGLMNPSVEILEKIGAPFSVVVGLRFAPPDVRKGQ